MASPWLAVAGHGWPWVAIADRGGVGHSQPLPIMVGHGRSAGHVRQWPTAAGHGWPRLAVAYHDPGA